MTQKQLITVARTHTVDFPKLTGKAWANPETLAKVAVLETVVVSFEDGKHPEKIFVLLEKATGKFVASWLGKKS
jgi:hypothetical protein